MNIARWKRTQLLAVALAYLGFSALQGLLSADEQMPPYTPTDRYEVRQIEGWTVLVNQDFLANQPDLCQQTLILLQHQLYQITRRVPPGPLEELRAIRFWVEENLPHNPCMVYHPNPKWVQEHGLNPEKAHCVELTNARNFLQWSNNQPWMALHELAHSYHNQHLDGGFENAEVKAAFEQAMADGRYDSVLRINGRKGRAYAAANVKEYFAEATEAFFGTNDVYPFVRAELQQHDPEIYTLLQKLWKAKR